jgi:hypothetical protein
MTQAGQVFELKRRRPDGSALWAFRYRAGGRASKRVQRGGFATEADARAALIRALERARRQQRRATRRLSLAELVEEYLVQHDVEPVTTAKLRWLLSKATGVFGSVPVDELRPEEIAAWRITIPIGTASRLRRPCAKCSAGPSFGASSTPTRQSSVLTIRSAARTRCARLTTGLTSRGSPQRSGAGMGR